MTLEEIKELKRREISLKRWAVEQIRTPDGGYISHDNADIAYMRSYIVDGDYTGNKFCFEDYIRNGIFECEFPDNQTLKSFVKRLSTFNYEIFKAVGEARARLEAATTEEEAQAVECILPVFTYESTSQSGSNGSGNEDLGETDLGSELPETDNRTGAVRRGK